MQVTTAATQGIHKRVCGLLEEIVSRTPGGAFPGDEAPNSRERPVTGGAMHRPPGQAGIPHHHVAPNHGFTSSADRRCHRYPRYRVDLRATTRDPTRSHADGGDGPGAIRGRMAGGVAGLRRRQPGVEGPARLACVRADRWTEPRIPLFPRVSGPRGQAGDGHRAGRRDDRLDLPSLCHGVPRAVAAVGGDSRIFGV